MKENEILELIDDYLFRRINDVDLERLKNLRMTDPEIDLQVLQSLDTFRVLQYARNQQLREKLRLIDKAEIKNAHRNRVHYHIIAGVVLFITIAGLWIWVAGHFSPASLASRFAEPASPTLLEQSGVPNEDALNWEFGFNALISGDFESARLMFRTFLQYPEIRIAHYAKWNYFLSRLGIEGPGKGLIQEIREFKTIAPDPIREKISALLQIIESPYYQILIPGLSLQLSALKPRLM